MTRRSFFTIALFMGIVASILSTSAPGGQAAAAEAALAAAIPPPTVNVNLGGSPDTLDPALASSAISLNVIEQLFIGLVDLDEETGEVLPELATTWSVSPDGLIYTFTLRSDVFWTDGKPVTATDVRYGILRSLDPATNASSAYLLFLIENAQAYHEGAVARDQVGVNVLDATHLQIKLEVPAAYFPTILTTWVARPMPQAAIETWGSDWTKPAHIVTNGAYRLAEWVSGVQIILEKNPTYFDAAAVQIERVKMLMIVDAGQEWQMYLDGTLDTAFVPLNAALDPLTQQQLHQQFISCTYYYGFVNNKPPLDDERVRMALAMGADKEFAEQFGNVPATHFAPPGVWGAPPLGTVGLEYNPPGARQLLKSYLIDKRINLATFNAMGITLMTNEGASHRLIAESVRRSWINNLGVYVTIKELPWLEFLEVIQKHTPLARAPHIFRMGWCSDYPDENNWLLTNFNNQVGDNRVRRGCVDDVCTTAIPQQFDLLTQQARSELNPVTRRSLYFQAERLLAEEEVAYLPLYHYGGKVAAKPYLSRSFPSFGGYDISTWRNTQVRALIGPSGGKLTSYDGKTTLDFPADAYESPALVTYAPASAMPPDNDLVRAGYSFEISAVDEVTGQPVELATGKTFTIIASYDSFTKGPVIEHTLALYYWNGSSWMLEPTSTLDTGANTVTATPGHHSYWSLLGETNRVFLPEITNGY